MTEEQIQIRIYKKDWKRLKNYGLAGDSMAKAMNNVLDAAEKVEMK
jgi:hypothetical protein